MGVEVYIFMNEYYYKKKKKRINLKIDYGVR